MIIGYDLEGFVNSMANLEHVTLYFDNLVDRNWTLSMIFHGIFLFHCEYMCVQVELSYYVTQCQVMGSLDDVLIKRKEKQSQGNDGQKGNEGILNFHYLSYA